MACGPCEERRRMLAEARKQAGVKGVAKALSMIARDIVKNPPNIRKRKWVK